MEVQKIIESKENLIEFLKEKGLQEEKDYSDEEYKEGTFFKINKRKLLVVYEIVDENNLKEIKDHFLIDRGLSYCIIVFNQKLIFFRNFGDVKHFIYSEKTKNNLSKKFRIGVFGSALGKHSEAECALARQLGEEIARSNCILVSFSSKY